MPTKRQRRIDAHPDEDPNQVMLDEFGKAYFLAKKKPTTAALLDRVTGTIVQGRITHYVIAKPARQIGDRPKVEKKFKLDADLVEAIEDRAEQDRCFLVDVVEAALSKYLLPAQ
ncbi:hypothetical protein [Pseudanabaena sp. FACHB-2040]|uniref:hypothetical protein n=1 Tax=Pseudanabaena sp. FACHB-2040 TaxID=2692859 RepID=UPI00168498AE|nr:hypothetical protein [Pseudanabaena sp. FACHB-2040]MBD2261354.1 hypothetical protein [Pseudanabaena sp. FACHB-2040]